MRFLLKNNTKYFQFVIVLALIFSLSSCKSTKAIAATGKASNKVSAKQLVKAHRKGEANFKTLQAKAKINLTQGDNSQGATFSLRMEKDKTIWLSAPLGLARMKITPQNVQFYNKTDNTYFDGNYQLLSDFVGFELDFNKVQNILLGQAIYDLKAQPHKINIQDNTYVLEPKEQDKILEIFYLFNPSHFKLNSLQMAQQSEKRFLQVDYKSYQEISKTIIPKFINIVAVQDRDQALVDMEIKSVKLNEKVRFPFKIPSGYKEMKLK